MGSILCEHCTGLCCQYVALPLERPTTRRDFDDIRWFVMHHGVTVFCEDGEWFVQFASRCENLRDDNLCGVYETRPEICREYKAGECDYQGGDYSYELRFTTAEQVEAYSVKKFGKNKGLTPARSSHSSVRKPMTRLKIKLHH